MNRKPQTKPCAEKWKTQRPTVPLTSRAIEELGGIDMAAKSISRVLGYQVNIKEVADLDPEQYQQLRDQGPFIKGAGCPPSPAPSPFLEEEGQI